MAAKIRESVQQARRIAELSREYIDEVVTKAAEELLAFAGCEEHLEALADHGAIEALVQLLQHGCPGAQKHAAGALYNLAFNDDNKVKIAGCGGIQALMALLSCDSLELRLEAADALGKLAKEKGNKVTIAEAGGIEALVALLRGDTMERKSASEAVQDLLSAELCPKVGAGCRVLPRDTSMEELVTIAKGGTDDEKLQVAKRFYSSNNQDQLKITGDAIRVLLNMLEGADTRRCAMQALRKLASHPEKRQELVDAGAIPALVQGLKVCDENSKVLAAQVLYFLALENDATRLQIIAQGFQALQNVQQTGSEQAQKEAINTLKELQRVSNTRSDHGRGTAVAMISARFNNPKGLVERTFREVHRILCNHQYDVLMVHAHPGENFGDLFAEYMLRLKDEHGTMLAVCTEDFGEMTKSAFSSYEELKYCVNNQSIELLPLRVEETYPPKPPGGQDHPLDKKQLGRGYVAKAFVDSTFFLDCRDVNQKLLSPMIVAGLIAGELHKKAAEAVAPDLPDV